jgi:phage tail tape-measure protein
MGMVLIAAVLAGCASSAPPTPVAYPAKGQSPEKQAKDSSECQAWAKQQTGYDPGMDTAKGAGVGLAVGALAGAATGAAIGAATGSAGRGAAVGAVVGGVGGTAVGAGVGYTRNKEGYERAYAACMQGRGYSVGR